MVGLEQFSYTKSYIGRRFYSREVQQSWVGWRMGSTRNRYHNNPWLSWIDGGKFEFTTNVNHKQCWNENANMSKMYYFPKRIIATTVILINIHGTGTESWFLFLVSMSIRGYSTLLVARFNNDRILICSQLLPGCLKNKRLDPVPTNKQMPWTTDVN